MPAGSGALHRPRAVPDGPFSPDPVEDQPEVPVGHLVAEEEEVATAEPRREGDRNDGGQLRSAEVVDVVVLGDDEALPFALRQRIDGSVKLQDDRAAVEAELGRVRVRYVDRPRGLPGWAMPEAAAMRAGRDVRDDVDLLAGLREGALERQVVVGRDDELVRRAPRTQDCRHACEETMERTRLDGRFEAGVQLVVQRTRALHRRYVLRDPRKVDRAVARDGEGFREMLREGAGPVETDDRDDPTREKRLHDLTVVVGGHRSAADRESCLVPEDLGLELLESGPGSIPSSSTKRARASW